MRKERILKFITYYNWARVVVIVTLVLLCAVTLCAQSPLNGYMPELHGVVRGKYEYSPDMGASRFELRNARVSVEGRLPMRAEYKVEMDLCDEGEIKMKSAWVRLSPWRSLRISAGYQRLPFSIDAHRNPDTQHFANRSFIAKQVGNVRDVGVAGGYDFKNRHGITRLKIDAGIFNGSNISDQKSAWHSNISYSARAQYFPTNGVAIVPSVHHTALADGAASYTSLDLGAFWTNGIVHLEAEYLRKIYSKNTFSDCNAMNAIAMVTHKTRRSDNYLKSVSLLARYDYMDNHSDGSLGFETEAPQRLIITDYARHRMTLGVTFGLCDAKNPVLLRINYEKYWYPNGGAAKESECDKLVAEIAVRI